MLLSFWFFLTIATLWVLKPIRSASLLAYLGAGELPYVRLGTVVVVGLVVALYSRTIERITRVTVARGACLLFALLLVPFWRRCSWAARPSAPNAGSSGRCSSWWTSTRP